MGSSIYLFLSIFFIESFAGWIIGTAMAAVRKRKFIDVGFLYGPYCPSYGLCGVLFSLLLFELHDHLFFMFLGGAIISFLVVYMTGFLLQKIFHYKWWDYSRKRFQFGSYVNMPYTLLWGLSAVVCVEVIEPLIKDGLSFIPTSIGQVIVIVLGIIMIIDFLGTLSGILSTRHRVKTHSLVREVSSNMQKTADSWGMKISQWTLKHFEQAYPEFDKKAIFNQSKEEKSHIFAQGCSFYKLVWLFFIGAFLGDIVETIFCYVTKGVIMSRSSVVYGSFSIVWGLGCAFLTLLLYQYREKSDRFIFIFGTLLGGAYEYACSVFTEMAFGTVFWDYSHIPFNLGGRINLLFCFFWGIVAVIWIKMIYPRLSTWIEKVPMKTGVILSWIMIVFMSVNIVISGLALQRYAARQEHHIAADHLSQFLDEHFPDEKMEKIYPNMIVTTH